MVFVAQFHFAVSKLNTINQDCNKKDQISSEVLVLT